MLTLLTALLCLCLCPLVRSLSRSMLALGGAVTLDDLAAHASADLSCLLGGIANEDLPARRAKVEAQVWGGGGGGGGGRQACSGWSEKAGPCQPLLLHLVHSHPLRHFPTPSSACRPLPCAVHLSLPGP